MIKRTSQERGAGERMDKQKGIVRRMDSVGRVVIPSNIRERAGLNDDKACEILSVEEGVLIRKAVVDESDMANLVKALAENISYLDAPDDVKKEAHGHIMKVFELFKKYRMMPKKNDENSDNAMK